MKRIFISFLLIFSLGSTMAFTGKVKVANVSNKVKESFSEKFEGARSIVWKDLGDYQEATFLIDGHLVDAYYNTDGELEGFGRNILKDELPLNVIISLKSHFKDAGDFDNVWEVSNADGASYWLTVKAPNKTKRVQVTPYGTILNVTKEKQNKNF
jgi:hypothetical protein